MNTLATETMTRRRRGALSRILRDRPAKIGVGIVAAIIGFVLVAPIFIPYDPNAINQAIRNQPPSLAHPFGTDYIGHDVMAQVVYGAYPTLLWGLLAALGSTSIGFVVGLLGGYYKKLEGIVSVASDVVLSFPSLVLLITIGSIFLATDQLIAEIIIVILWSRVARAIRPQVISVKKRAYVDAARTSGLSEWRILWEIVAPEVGPIGMSFLILTVSLSILLAASVEFLGVGNLSEISWGTTLYFAQQYGFFAGDWWWVAAPGILLGLTASGFALVGFSVEKVLNPRLGK